MYSCRCRYVAYTLRACTSVCVYTARVAKSQECQNSERFLYVMLNVVVGVEKPHEKRFSGYVHSASKRFHTDARRTSIYKYTYARGDRFYFFVLHKRRETITKREYMYSDNATDKTKNVLYVYV